MNTTLIYLLKVNIAIALFYMFYRLFFAGDTLWKARRFYLLFSVLISFAYPLFSIEQWLQGQKQVQELVMTYVQLPEFAVNADKGFSLSFLMGAIYLSVVFVLLVRMLLQLISIFNIRKSGVFAIVQNTRVMTINKEIAPFSFFGTIYINPALHNEEETKQILLHELTHVQQWHSLDVIISELLCIAFWINPATWLLKREIRQNLEFLADNKVIDSGFDCKSYQYHLLQLSYQTPDYRLSNKFNVLPLKKRIIMMNKKKSSKSTVLKYLLIVPLSFSLVVISNAETLVSKAKNLLQNESSAVDNEKNVSSNDLVVVGYAAQTDPQKETTITPPSSAESEKNMVFTVVEQMPKFPGGDQALFKFLGDNVEYPAQAMKNGVQGRVICSFVVNVDGSIADVEVVRGVDAELDAEAIRVIKSFPKWEPGMQRNKAVRVKYVLPINYKVDSDKNTNNGKEISLSTENPPLIVLDGKVQPSDFKVSSLDSKNIEKVEVLKDASATSIYGDSGKNGVIIITSKK